MTKPSWDLPEITVSESDEARLASLALQICRRQPSHPTAKMLLAELQRADVVPDDRMASSTIRMGSTVEYQIDGGTNRVGKLVFPIDADFAKGQISILSPIGSALVGLSTGQEMAFEGADGQSHIICVISVRQSG